MWLTVAFTSPLLSLTHLAHACYNELERAFQPVHNHIDGVSVANFRAGRREHVCMARKVDAGITQDGVHPLCGDGKRKLGAAQAGTRG